MRKVVILVAVLGVAGCGGGASGAIGSACVRSDRAAASPSLCSCIQQVANQTLAGSDQNRIASFFGDPERAEATRSSDTARDDAFWDRYTAFADRAEAICG